MTKDLLAQAFKRSEHIVSRRIAGEYVLVPLVSKRADLDSIFDLNRVAAFIWERLDGRRSGADVVADLTSQYEVSPEQAEQDYRTFLEQLLSIRAIEPVA